MNSTISYVSLGPGSADLITLRALNRLKESDVIFSPSTITRDGRESSRAFDIMQELGIDASKIKLYHLPMSKDRTKALAAYNKVALEALEATLEGKKVSITAEGDAGMYSSCHYIIESLAPKNVGAEKVPGIPAFIACGAFANLHVAMQEENLLVMAKGMSAEELQDRVDKNETLVLMKASQCEAAVKELIANNTTKTINYFENIGYDNEYYTIEAEEILKRKFPYFSLIIIKTNDNV